MPEASVPASAPVLPPRYYLDNFRRLRAAVEQRYGDLLMPAEQSLLARFDTLPEPAQCLYLRLASRVGPWFRSSRLRYVEIGEPGPALDALVAAGLAEDLATLSLETLARLFTRAEIAALYGCDLAGAARLSKSALLAAVAGLDGSDEARWRRLCERAPERISAPLGLSLLELLQLLFFGNRRQGLVDFVLSDLGIARYWPYALDRETRLFPDREAVEEYRAVAELAERYWLWCKATDRDGLAPLAEAALALSLRHGPARRRCWRLYNRLGRACERQGLTALALSLYERSERHPARERRARVLERLGREAEALAAVEALLAAPWCEDEAAAAGRMARRLRQRLRGERQRRPRDRFATAALTVPAGERGIERATAAQLAARDGLTVRYVENALLPGLFGLAFWEELFAPVPGAFHHPYQAGPADSFSGDFRRRRAALLAARFRILAGADLEEELGRAWQRYRGYQCHWVDWRRLDEALVRQAARCIPFAHLAGVWERLLFDPAQNRRGFPDLVALGESCGDYRLYEVKGPGDALAEHQRRWLNHLADLGAPVAVLQVSWDRA